MGIKYHLLTLSELVEKKIKNRKKVLEILDWKEDKSLILRQNSPETHSDGAWASRVGLLVPVFGTLWLGPFWTCCRFTEWDHFLAATLWRVLILSSNCWRLEGGVRRPLCSFPASYTLSSITCWWLRSTIGYWDRRTSGLNPAGLSCQCCKKTKWKPSRVRGAAAWAGPLIAPAHGRTLIQQSEGNSPTRRQCWSHFVDK